MLELEEMIMAIFVVVAVSVTIRVALVISMVVAVAVAMSVATVVAMVDGSAIFSSSRIDWGCVVLCGGGTITAIVTDGSGISSRSDFNNICINNITVAITYGSGMFVVVAIVWAVKIRAITVPDANGSGRSIIVSIFVVVLFLAVTMKVAITLHLR